MTYSPGTWSRGYYPSFSGYWGYGWGAVHAPGYLRTDTVVTVETLVYSVPDDKLLWAGVSGTTNPEKVGTGGALAALARAGPLCRPTATSGGRHVHPIRPPRRDALAGLTCALLVIFARPIRVVLDAARAFEDSHGLSLVPALVILTAVFVFQQQAKLKAINDRLGHLAGDAVLSAIGRQLREVLRGADVKCRYGGEEFLILLPDTPAPGAMRVAESLRQAFDEMNVRWEGGGWGR